MATRGQSPNQPEQSHWTEPLQHTSDAVMSLLDNFTQVCQEVNKVQDLIQDGQYFQAQNHFKRLRGQINRQGQLVQNFLNQTSRMQKGVNSYNRRIGSTPVQSEGTQSSGSVQTRSYGRSRISSSSLPDDPRELEQIVANAQRKLGKAA